MSANAAIPGTAVAAHRTAAARFPVPSGPVEAVRTSGAGGLIDERDHHREKYAIDDAQHDGPGQRREHEGEGSFGVLEGGAHLIDAEDLDGDVDPTPPTRSPSERFSINWLKNRTTTTRTEATSETS